MIEVNKVFREQLIAALASVSYNSEAVPVYDKENPNRDDLYIIIGEQTGADNGTKTTFDTDGTVLIDIVHRYKSLTFSVTDNVAGQVKHALRPTPQSVGIASTAELQIALLKCISDNTLHFDAPSGYVMRRLLRYQFIITEK
jgi:hypothetical protein